MRALEQCSAVKQPGRITDERLRRSIRTISTLQYVIASVLFVSGIVLLIRAGELSLRHAGILAIVAVAIFLFVLAGSVRKFRPWARTPTIIISFIGVVAFPLGTLIYGPFLYVLIKGKHLFAQNPQPCDAPRPEADADRLAA